MDKKIGYAMSNEQALDSFIWFNNPFELAHWTFPLMEFIWLLGGVIALIYAFQHYKRTGSCGFLLCWIAIILHGLWWELVVYNVESMTVFWHGEFSIMMFHNRYPFYILFGMYPTLFCLSMAVTQRFGLIQNKWGKISEALATGFTFVTTWFICESFSPIFQWWTWDLTQPSATPSISGIPGTAYLWAFSYGTSFAFLARHFLLGVNTKQHSTTSIIGRVLIVALLVPLVAMIFLLPYQILSYTNHADLSAVLFIFCVAGSGWLFYLSPKHYATHSEKLLWVFPAVYITANSVLYIIFFDLFLKGGILAGIPGGDAPGNLLIGMMGIAISSIIIHNAKLSGR